MIVSGNWWNTDHQIRAGWRRCSSLENHSSDYYENTYSTVSDLRSQTHWCKIFVNVFFFLFPCGRVFTRFVFGGSFIQYENSKKKSHKNIGPWKSECSSRNYFTPLCYCQVIKLLDCTCDFCCLRNMATNFLTYKNWSKFILLLLLYWLIRDFAD